MCRNPAKIGHKVVIVSLSLSLGTDPSDPVFWESLKLARNDRAERVKPGSFSALIAAYKNTLASGAMSIQTTRARTMKFLSDGSRRHGAICPSAV